MDPITDKIEKEFSNTFFNHEEKKSKRPKVSLMGYIHPSDKQRLAFEMLKKYRYLLYGGAMYGGKSYWLRWALVSLLVYYAKKYGIKNVVAGLFCEDYPALKDRHLSKVESEFPWWLGKMHSDHKAFGRCFILDHDWGSGVLAFRNLDDPSKYASAEFAAIGVDELTKNPYETFVALRHRNRWPGIDDPKFIAGTNPGSIGHVWVKKYWMDQDFPPEEEEGDQFGYCPAKYSDNPNKNPAYEKTLNSLPPKLRRAFRDGDWDTFEGQYFEEWNQQWNVERPFEIPDHWMRFMWMDYGYAKPSAVYWAALDEIGRIHVYRELYVTGHTYRALAKKIMKMTPAKEVEMLDGNMVADPAIFAKKGEDVAEKSGAEQMFEESEGWLNFKRGNNDRVNGWGVMREYVKPFTFEGQTTSKLIYFSTCKDAVRTIPGLVHDSIRVEDVDSDGEDHAGDASRYGVMDIFDMFSEKKPEEHKNINRTDVIKARDLKLIRERREEQQNNVDWMTM